MTNDTDDGTDEPDREATTDERTSDDHASSPSTGTDGSADTDDHPGDRPDDTPAGGKPATGATDPAAGRVGGEHGDVADNTDRSAGVRSSPSRPPSQEPYVSLTIEGEYESVFERVEHPRAFQHTELDQIMDNVESTLVAVVGTGGGIRSEIYEEVDFELDDPWEIRKYLELLEMHDLIRLRDDRWVPSDYFEQPDDESG